MKRLQSIGSLTEYALSPKEKNSSYKKHKKSLSEQLREERIRLFSNPVSKPLRERRKT